MPDIHADRSVIATATVSKQKLSTDKPNFKIVYK